VVGVPALGLLLGELLAVGGGDLVDGRGLVRGGLGRARVGVERAELARERRVLVLVETLVAEEDDLVLEDGGLDLVPLLGAQRAAEVHPADLRTDRGLKRPDGEGAIVDDLIGHCGHRDSQCPLN